MSNMQIVEISQDGRFLGVERGFLIVKENSKEIGKLPLDTINCIITSANWTIFSSSLISKLATENVPLVICDKITKYPVSMTLALEGNYRQSYIMQAQADASLPLKKSLWQEIVKAKIKSQSNILKLYGNLKDARVLAKISENVRSGDSQNCEAHAAAIYWKGLFGKDFKRDRNLPDENLLLNWGYTVFRASVAKAVIGAGLSPCLGLHHKSMGNSMRLVDDLIEPFRAIIDFKVKEIVYKYDSFKLTAIIKKELASTVEMRVKTKFSTTSVFQLMYELCKSLAKIYVKEEKELYLPEIKWQ